MRLVTFDNGEAAGVGALIGDDVVLDLARADSVLRGAGSPDFASMMALIEGGEGVLECARACVETAPDEAVIQRSDVRLLAPLPRPSRLRDAGMFVEHLEIIRKEMARIAAQSADDPELKVRELLDTDQYRVPDVLYDRVCYYNGNHLAVIGPDAPLHWPRGVEVLDYELELAIIVGSGGADLSPAQAEQSVFGYCVMNDWSARDVQIAVSKSGAGPCMGKDFATSLGPCIVTADEIADPHALDMSASVNGAEWSRGTTRNMHHTVYDALAEFSRIAPLAPGEVIGSGTPAYGSATEQGKRLAPGDEVVLRIDGIGELANRIVK